MAMLPPRPGNGLISTEGWALLDDSKGRLWTDEEPRWWRDRQAGEDKRLESIAPYGGIRWTGSITPPETGEYRVYAIRHSHPGQLKLWVDGKQQTTPCDRISPLMHFEGGKSYPIRIEAPYDADQRRADLPHRPGIRLMWTTKRVPGRKTFWLPPGQWHNLFSGEILDGGRTGRTLTVRLPIDEYPAYARGGAVIPKQPNMPYVGESPVDPLILDVYGGGESSFRLYEDAGDGLAYRKNEFSRQTFRVENTATEMVFKVSTPDGKYPGIPPKRGYLVRLHPPKGRRFDRVSASLRFRQSRDGRVLVARIPPTDEPFEFRGVIK